MGDRNPLFDTMFAIQNTDETILNRGNLHFKPIINHMHKVSKFDLTLSINVSQTKLTGSFEYCTKLFRKKSIEIMSKNLITILSTITSNPNIKLGRIELGVNKKDTNAIDLYELRL